MTPDRFTPSTIYGIRNVHSATSQRDGDEVPHALVPVEGLPESSRFKSLSCPTSAVRPIEFQWLFLTLSHRFDGPIGRAATAIMEIGLTGAEFAVGARFGRSTRTRPPDLSLPALWSPQGTRAGGFVLTREKAAGK
jgi:hypothetical protein